MAKEKVSHPFAPSSTPGPYHIALHSTEGGSDKIFEISIVSDDAKLWSVDCANGRRGRALTPQPKTPDGPVDYAVAQAIAEGVLNEKVKKGYNPINSLSGHYGLGAAPYRKPEDSGVRPQLLKVAKAEDIDVYINDDRFVMQEKHDGDRRLARLAGEQPQGVNKLGMTAVIPAPLLSVFKHSPVEVLLDGELIGDRYVAFDLLEADGVDLRSQPLISRLAKLQQVVTDIISAANETGSPTHLLQIVYTARTAAEKRALLQEIESSTGEGVVIKEAAAPYIAERNDTQLKHKFWQSLSAIVAGQNGTKRSVAMVLLDEHGHQIDVGSVTIPVNHTLPNPGSVIEVRYLYAYEGGSLFTPTFLKLRDDIVPAECTADQRVFKQEYAPLAAPGG
jgi:bifunctional non-homologous end joining protein LigD